MNALTVQPDAVAAPQPVSASNADTAEIHKFSDMAHQWWDADGVLKTLHHINPLRLGWIQSQTTLRGAHVLDVGCGGGILAESMALAGANVLGIDLAEESLRVAQLHALEQNATSVRYQHISAEELARAQPTAFDVVTCMELLEHVPAPSQVVAACAQAVKPGGWVFFSTINRNPKAFVQAIVGAEYVLRMVPRGTHRFNRLIRPSELLRDCRAAGLDATAMQGLHYNPLTQRYWLDTQVDVNYMLACRKWG